ncbi:MAG: CmpA/NrtA family ABC transporter substrate-binding protein, partial [Gammaproteobacteria bacterium]|nr:CmpA/NrtA family ABC transporter substrate-binding protein [Gammaproteobacteria bacterium]
MRRNITAGFVPLVDAAPLIAAAERGFAEAEGLRLRLVKQNSWASLRDHLLLGHIDCAQALAPLPIAAALGIGQVKVTTAVPFVLSRGGNAITLSTRLCDEIRRGNAGTTPVGARAWAEALARVVRDRDEPLTLAMVYPFSGHNFELRYWLAAAGIHPDRDVRVVAVPPPLMVDSLRAGHVDGFCVGEPWNSLAAAMDIGEIVARKSDIFPRGIEKVLAMPEAMLADQTKSKPLIRALFAAAFWCDRAENRGELAELLAMPKYLDIDPVLSLQALRGSLPVAGMPTDPDFLFFSRYDANRPRAEEALWLYAQMRRWGQ